MKQNLSTPEKHQLRIAKQTLNMPDIVASIMGGMTKNEAREFLKTKMKWTDAKIQSFEE